MTCNPIGHFEWAIKKSNDSVLSFVAVDDFRQNNSMLHSSSKTTDNEKFGETLILMVNDTMSWH